MNKWVLLILCIGLTIGCEVVPFVGPIILGYVTWVEGEAKAYYNTDATSAHNAMIRTLKELNYPIKKDEKISLNEYFITSDTGDRFKISIVENPSNITCIGIRINILGDKPQAEMIYKKLEGQLDVIEFPKQHLSRRRKLSA